MAKIKVHELAKELELQSKDILSFLQEKGIEAKAAQSSLEEDAAALVRNSLGKKKAAAPAAQKAPVNTENAKPAEEKAQAPAGEAKAQETNVSEETKSTEETKDYFRKQPSEFQDARTASGRSEWTEWTGTEKCRRTASESGRQIPEQWLPE